MTRHWTYRAVAAVLMLVLLFQLMPLQTLAATTGSAAAEVSQEQVSASILGEDPSLRTRTQKHFRLSDGSFLAVSYGVPVHYQDDSGHWQEIDNTLTLSGSAYRVENGQLTAAYSTTLSTGQLFAVTNGDMGVSMRLLDTSQAQTMTGEQLSANANAQLIQNGLTYDRTTSASLEAAPAAEVSAFSASGSSDTHGWTAEELLPEGLSASIVYGDVFPGVDLKYTAYSHNIKEQIIVNERQSAYRYDFFLELSGLSPTLNTDGSISLTDEEGVAAYTIPAPYMEDSMGYSSTAVTYTLTAVTGGAVLTVEADAAWINAEDRSFPVSIDPTLVLNTGNDNEDIYAAFSMELAPSDTTLGRQYLYVGNMPYGNTVGLYRLFMHFHNLPSIPEGSVITDATLQMYQFEFPHSGVNTLPLAAYDVTTEKPSNLDYYYWFRQICWDSEPDYDTTNAIDYAIGSSTNGYRYWNLTELAKQWYAGTKDATIAIIADESLLSPNARATSGFHAYSSGVPPILTVTYRSIVGI